jgi:hypothetical protein
MEKQTEAKCPKYGAVWHFLSIDKKTAPGEMARDFNDVR